jgi:hypothetical protein
MQKPKDFDTAKAFGEFEQLPPGGYVCKIIGVEEVTSQKGSPMIKIAVDIAEGPQKDWYNDIYKNDTREFKKWPASGIIYQVVENRDGSTNGYFKAFVDAVVESNNNFMVEWGDKFAACFKGKLVGVIFAKEEYQRDDGERRWTVKPQQGYKTVKDIRKGNFKVPEDKPLTAPSGEPLPAGFSAVTDEDIPF